MPELRDGVAFRTPVVLRDLVGICRRQSRAPCRKVFENHGM
jgi:hypothetical protein